MKKSVRVGAAQGFWGDRTDAPLDLATHGNCDYLVLDYLAEVTMSILQRQKLRNPEAGYARDFPRVARELAPFIAGGGKVITNAGGVNPEACARAVLHELEEQGLRGVKVGLVAGDDIFPDLKELVGGGESLKNMESGAPLSDVLSKVVSANVYFGAKPIAAALGKGAQVVVTGRCTDTGLTLAPLAHEFKWRFDDWDRLAAGTVAGHLLECGAQASGGNFSADWESVPGMCRIGYPIAEGYPDGSFVITKPQSLGGLVNEAVVKEQILYELGDPRHYISPDCVVDFTTIRLKQEGEDRVRVSGVKGGPATPFYKVSVAYLWGWKAEGTLTYTWPNALKKVAKAEEILRRRFDHLGLEFEKVLFERLGVDACHGPLAPAPAAGDDLAEVVLRVAVRGHHKAPVERFGYELAPLILTGPPSVTGFAGGRPKPSEVVAYWPALMRKTAVEPTVRIVEE